MASAIVFGLDSQVATSNAAVETVMAWVQANSNWGETIVIVTGDHETDGSDFLDLDTSEEFPNPWARSTCGIGHLPCNGLLYLGPPACSCCNWVMLNALNALAPEPGLETSGQPVRVKTRPQLEEGPAYKQLPTLSSQLSALSDWPTYRQNAGRTGVTKEKAPAEPSKAPAAQGKKKRRPPRLAAMAASQRWSTNIPLTGKAMALAGDVLFVAGTPVAFPEGDLARAYEGRMGGVLWAAFASTGEKKAELKLDAPPAWDAMAVANGRLYLSLADGRVTYWGGK